MPRLFFTRPRRTSERGTSLVEFALAVPVAILILVGILEFGVVMWQKNSVVEAARDAARQATVDAEGDNGACGTQYNWLAAACQVAPAGSSVCIEAPDGSFDRRNRVTVRVTYTYNWVTPLMQGIANSADLSFDGTSTMRMEQDGSNLPAPGAPCPTTST